jgi:FKBP-type peptidyl-prolyl cis-trans isomerase FklB
LKKITLTLVAAAVFVTAGYSQDKKKNDKSSSALKTEIDSVSYAIGVNIASNLKSQGFDNVDADILAKAIKDGRSGSVSITPEKANEILGNYYQNMQKKKASDNAEKGKKFLAENKKNAGVVELPSGLQYQVMTEGTGDKPAATDKVTVHYHGTLLDGTVFDSSVQRGEPASFGLNMVIKGWTEGLQLMKTGAKYKFFIPAELAYGDNSPSPAIAPGSTLIFEVELLSIEKQ